MSIELKNGQKIKISSDMNNIKREQVKANSLKLFDMLDINKNKELDFNEISCIDVSKKLHDAMDGLGTDDSFNEYFKEITSKNIISVLQYYQQNFGASLLQDIAHEYEIGGLPMDDRVKYLTKIKDLAIDWAKEQKFNIDSEALGKEFDAELKKQQKKVGRMNTDKLNIIIGSITNPSIANNQAKSYLVKYDSNNINEKDMINQILKNKKIANADKINVINQIIQKKSNDKEAQVNIISRFFFEALNSSKNLEYSKLLKHIDEKNLPMIFDEYEKISMSEGVRNTANYDRKNHIRPKRPAAYWEQILPQAILNNKNMTPADKKEFLGHFINIAERVSEKSVKLGYITAEQRSRYIKDARKIVETMNYNKDNNADLYYILVYQLLPVQKSAFQGIRKHILPDNNYTL